MANQTRKTGVMGRGAYVKGWAKQSPGLHQRTVMLKKCGKKCFLGANKTFPICAKNTCSVNKKGIHSAYIRARQRYSMTKRKKYKQISNKAYKMLYK